MAILLPTSTAGSLPKPSWLAEPEKLWSPWKLEGEALIEAKQDALRLSLQEQVHAGIDISVTANKLVSILSPRLLNIWMALILRNVKQCEFVIVMMRVYLQWLVR